MGLEEVFSLEDFKDSIPFTALGARTCYSSGDLDYLLNDPRIVSKEERAKFLSKLGNYKHFSVFAHSFAYKDLSELPEDKLDRLLEDSLKDLPKYEKARILALKISATNFKSHYNPKYPTVIGISLRHYLERLLDIDEKIYFETFNKMAEYDIPIQPLGKEDNVTLIGMIKDYDGYAVFFIDNVSRTMTHQLVRHTALNYSQRSQRYVKEDENSLVIPPSVESSEIKIKSVTEEFLKIIDKILNEVLGADTKQEIKDEIRTRTDRLLRSFSDKESISLKELFTLNDQLSQIVYDFAVYRGKVKREDARFILPHGRKTTIVVSGTLYWIKDFITKRTDPHAQWEIRDTAIKMKKLLENQGIVF
ncbi:MAG TPA: FAD-dependent thymidylate synthase [Persephonella sp.]|uniref:Thymidylate synthase ThyX (TS) (TSase) n=1 Tax=Persephonella marina (strain DSM 14350 / EX-H1) TaxID=123214 RepID=C0QRW8_PERMH|nr:MULTISPECIES: FAD-dependent thymidylate synthase [Persephonella]ACO03531.1 thymidylate synthase ThyX (TS) (TSase) [Persephonella marina EX-H1]HCB69159.1 FAD-dependent thymidylate synthase [Persephonella sp.]